MGLDKPRTVSVVLALVREQGDAQTKLEWIRDYCERLGYRKKLWEVKRYQHVSAVNVVVTLVEKLPAHLDPNAILPGRSPKRLIRLPKNAS